MTGRYPYRTPDGDIDLDRALGRHLVHYTGVMISGAADIRPEAYLPAGEHAPPLEGTLVRLGHGRPTRASSCGTVAVQPSFVWDVCAYYLLLGAHWRATRRELMLAYKAADPYEEDSRLKYCLAQLMDAGTRRAYDMMPLGGVFHLDREVDAQLKRAAALEAARRVADGEEWTSDEVLEEMGFVRNPPGEGGEPAREPARPAAPSWASQWGHYAVSGPQGPVIPVPALLEAWQGMIAAALRRRGIVMSFAVAQGRENSVLVLRNVNEPCIFVLTEESISPDKANEAVELGITLGIVTENPTGGI